MIEKSVIELTFCISRLNNFSKTFRIMVESTEVDVYQSIIGNVDRIALANGGSIGSEEVQMVAEAVKTIQEGIGSNWLEMTSTSNASASSVKVMMRPGCTLDVYKFVHDLYGITGE